MRLPGETAEQGINAFLAHLPVKEKVSASTQNQALSALWFLYRNVFSHEISNFRQVVRTPKPTRIPVMMSRNGVKTVPANLSGDKRLMAWLMYGAGLRLMERLRLRVQYIDFSRNEILVWDDNGEKN